MNAKTFTLSRTARRAAFNLGFSPADVAEAFFDPKAVYPSKQRPGQWRIASRHVCLIGVPDGETFKVITVIRNGSKAPQRDRAVA